MILITVVLGLSNCARSKKKENFQRLYQQSYTGFDLHGSELGCKLESNRNCDLSKLDSAQRAYEEDCERQNYRAVLCECRYFICTQQVEREKELVSPQPVNNDLD